MGTPPARLRDGRHLVTTKQGVLIGCAGVALVFLVLIVSVAVWFRHVAQDPEGVAVSLEGPQAVAKGEEFALTVVVKNEREQDPFDLTDIDIAEEYLEGFFILGTDPAAKSSMHVPIDNSRSFSFNTPIPPRESRRFSFRLRATMVGVFRGDVDVCEGSRFLTAFAQTLVAEPE